MKKTVHFLFTVIPAILMIGIQILCVTIASVLITAIVSSQSESVDMSEVLRVSEEIFLKKEMIIYFIIQLMSIVIFGLWFFGAKMNKNLTGKYKWKDRSVWFGILSLSVAMYMITFLFMLAMELLFPRQMLEYSKIMQGLQLDHFGIIPFLNVVILAPIGEEIIFRGITMNYAKKITNHFWIANIVQAALFGLVHMNLIQGIYAFVLGLVLGYLSQTYQSIYVAMIMHAIYNFCGSVVANALEGIPINLGNSIFAMVLLVFLLWFGIREVRKTKR